jgi:hypothetical protein
MASFLFSSASCFPVKIPPAFRVTDAAFSDSLASMANAAPRAGNPKALHAVTRQRLLLINGLLDEVSRNYVARLHREIVELTRALESAARDGNLRDKDLRAILKKIEHLQIDPERGRRKDLKKIDTLIGEVQLIVEAW